MLRYNYIKYDAISEEKDASFKEHFEAIAGLADSIADPWAKSHMLQSLDVCVMWVGKGIKADQLAREAHVD